MASSDPSEEDIEKLLQRTYLTEEHNQKATLRAPALPSPSMPLDIVLIRHGESEGNYMHHLFKETRDPNVFTHEFLSRHTSQYRLTEKGKKQAEEAGRFLKTKYSEFDAYYTSGYLRAMETAALLGLNDVLWRQDIYLREREMGVLGTHTSADVKRIFMSSTERYSKHDALYWTPPGGESYADTALRVDRFLDKLARDHSGQRVLVVCHGNIMKTFKIRLEHMTQVMFYEWEEHNSIDNCQILWYSRIDPSTKRVSPYISYVTSIKLYQAAPIVWNPIEIPYFSNSDLLKIVSEYPQIVPGRS